MTEHVWTAGVKNNQPVLTCANSPCRIVWWPDRRQPKSSCTGRPAADAAAEFVRAVIVGSDK